MTSYLNYKITVLTFFGLSYCNQWTLAFILLDFPHGICAWVSLGQCFHLFHYIIFSIQCIQLHPLSIRTRTLVIIVPYSCKVITQRKNLEGKLFMPRENFHFPRLNNCSTKCSEVRQSKARKMKILSRRGKIHALQLRRDCCLYRMSKISRSSTENSRPQACYFPIIQKFKEANLLEISPWYAALAASTIY